MTLKILWAMLRASVYATNQLLFKGRALNVVCYTDKIGFGRTLRTRVFTTVDSIDESLLKFARIDRTFFTDFEPAGKAERIVKGYQE